MPLSERDMRVLWLSMGAFEGSEWLFTLNRSRRRFACEPACLAATNCCVISLWVNMRGYCNGLVLTYQIDLRSPPPPPPTSSADGNHWGKEKPAIVLRWCPLYSVCCSEIKEREEPSEKRNQPAPNWINKSNNYVVDLKGGRRPPCWQTARPLWQLKRWWSRSRISSTDPDPLIFSVCLCVALGREHAGTCRRQPIPAGHSPSCGAACTS